MNLVRHDLGLSQDREPVSRPGHLPCDLFPLRPRRYAYRTVPRSSSIPGARAGRRIEEFVRSLCRKPSTQNVLDYETIACSIGRKMVSDASARRRNRRAGLRSRDCRRVPCPPSACNPRSCGAEAGRTRPHLGRRTTRSRSIRSAPPPCATSWISGPFQPPAPRSSRWTELPFDAVPPPPVPGRRQLASSLCQGRGGGGGRFTITSVPNRTSSRKPQLAAVSTSVASARYIVEQVLANSRGMRAAETPRCCSSTSSHIGPAGDELTRRNIPLRQVRRAGNSSPRRMSSTCWHCCGSSKIRETASPAFASCIAAGGWAASAQRVLSAWPRRRPHRRLCDCPPPTRAVADCRPFLRTIENLR